MVMRLLVISDIHGNLSALEAVLKDSDRFHPDGIAMLGDFIDYGMRSNEVVACLASIGIPITCALWGNHEEAIMNGDYTRFSSLRGSECAQRTAKMLSQSTMAWLEALPGKSGMQQFVFGGNRFLALHGSLTDPFWGTITPKNAAAEDFEKVDIVLSGHNHVPHAFSLFAAANAPAMRNKRRVCFLNPGSVGQPRNHSPKACYAIWDSEMGVSLVSVDYPLDEEQALYDGSVDDFYRTRLAIGV